MAASRSPALIIQFAREPVVGEVKTRLIGQLTARQACDLHCELVRTTCHTLVTAAVADVELAVAGATGDSLFRQCLALGVDRITRQCGRDLGERMYNALVDGLARYERVLLVGSDCPGIDSPYLARALRELDHAPVVLGPAEDGGYVLIGARKIEPAVFRGVKWGTAKVFADTVSRLDRLGLRWRELPVLADIDRPADLARWRAP